MEGKMKSKIEKLERIPDDKRYYDESDFVKEVIEKINMIIDYLNSQSQPEEKSDDDNNWYCSKCGEPADKGEHICDEDYKKKVKDTPEEWEDRIRDLILDISADRLVSSEKVVAIVQSLLDDREREVLENMRDWVVEYTLGNYKVRDFDAEIAVGKIIDRELDKLNSKKK